eukprot:2179039-Pleurochrysis_carterae.AAC.7
MNTRWARACLLGPQVELDGELERGAADGRLHRRLRQPGDADEQALLRVEHRTEHRHARHCDPDLPDEEHAGLTVPKRSAVLFEVARRGTQNEARCCPNQSQQRASKTMPARPPAHSACSSLSPCMSACVRLASSRWLEAP